MIPKKKISRWKKFEFQAPKLQIPAFAETPALRTSTSAGRASRRQTKQAPSTNSERGRRFYFGFWKLTLIWDLVFGI